MTRRCSGSRGDFRCPFAVRQRNSPRVPLRCVASLPVTAIGCEFTSCPINECRYETCVKNSSHSHWQLRRTRRTIQTTISDSYLRAGWLPGNVRCGIRVVRLRLVSAIAIVAEGCLSSLAELAAGTSGHAKLRESGLRQLPGERTASSFFTICCEALDMPIDFGAETPF